MGEGWEQGEREERKEEGEERVLKMLMLTDSEDRGSMSHEMQEDPRNQKKQINNSPCSLWRHTPLLTLVFRTSDL